MASTVDRTFVINFKTVPSKLKYADISDFIVQKLDFPLTEIKHLQITNGRVFVGTESPEIAQNMVQNHNMKHQVEHEGKLYTIPLSMEDGTIEVRIHDLRPRISNQQLVHRMREFGQVSSIREEVWKDFFPGVPNGVRILRMRLLKPIPSYIVVDTVSTLVTYRGQVATCKHCNRNVHYTQTCSEYAKSLRSSVNERLTVADVVKNSSEHQTQDQDQDEGDFIEVKRSRRSGTSRFAGALEKGFLRHRSRSNISLARSEISFSSTEGVNLTSSASIEQSAAVFSAPEPVAASTVQDQNTSMETSDDSPPFLGFPSLESASNNNNGRKQQKQHSTQPTTTTTANVNISAVPMQHTDKSITDNRAPRSKTRTDSRTGLRSRSSSKTKQ